MQIKFELNNSSDCVFLNGTTADMSDKTNPSVTATSQRVHSVPGLGLDVAAEG